MTKKGTNFDHAMLRMINANIDSESLRQVFENLKEAANTAQTESAALTLGFSDDDMLVAGDYVPTMTLSLVKVSEEHAKTAAEHVAAREQAKNEALEEYKELVLEEMKEAPEAKETVNPIE